MGCFDNVIGLTNKDCDCFPDKPSDAGTSDTDLYIDELDGMPLDFSAAIAECGEEGGLWAKMILAKKTAIINTSTDLLACIAKNNSLDLKTHTGYIGGQGFKKQLTISTGWAGLKLIGNDKKSSYIKINSVSLSINESGSFVVHVYNNRDSAALASYTVTTVANRTSTFPVPSPLTLPLFDDKYGPINYYVVYERGSSQPKDTNVLCGSCGSGKGAVSEYLEASGVLGEIMGDFDARLADYSPATFKTSSSYSYGLSLGVSLECDSREIICKNYEQDVNFKQYFGQATLYKSGENLLNYVLNSPEINRFTSANREHLYGRRNHFRKEYIDHISYLCGVVDLSKTACFKCKKVLNNGRLIS